MRKIAFSTLDNIYSIVRLKMTYKAYKKQTIYYNLKCKQ